MSEPALLALGEGLEQPGLARQFVRDRLGGYPSALCDDALVMVSEIVTNAVLYGSAPSRVEVLCSPPVVRVTVFDSGPPFVVPSAQPSADAGSGRGLLIVAAMAMAWGVEVAIDAVGKSVWFELGG